MINGSYEYKELTEEIEVKLDEADYAASSSNIRYTHEEVFSKFRNEYSEHSKLPHLKGAEQ